MTDVFSKVKRSQIMATISSKETKQEVAVRSYLFSEGFRFRKNVATLPGTPDIVLPKLKTIIFIHGCFWHGHRNCRNASLPTSNIEFWENKIQKNIARDKRVKLSLKKLGWKIIIIWECKLKNKISFDKSMKGLLKQLES
jgi:DNA mismatch endonuclease, patch repair protein